MKKESTQQFASDNWSGVCPEALHYFLEANKSGQESAYGEDRWTQQAADGLRRLFDTDCDVYFVFNGTAANSLALAAMCQSYHSVLCSPVAHIETDECGGPEFFSNGSKLLVTEGDSASAKLGKITPEAIQALVTKRTDIHYPRPKVVSVTQATELGSVYSVEELQAISAEVKKHDLKFHMDGARFANAVAHLECHPGDITWRIGVDVLCFGGTKNGLPAGEAVIFFDNEMSKDFAWRVKQAGQLASKMRFISAPWLGILENDAWLKHARQANTMAQRLYLGLRGIESKTVKIQHEPQANSVFVHMPEAVASALFEQGWHFYQFIAGSGCRLMCSWDTEAVVVDAFIADITRITSILG
jgi:threonine aldolase